MLSILISELLTAVFTDYTPNMRGHGTERYLAGTTFFEQLVAERRTSAELRTTMQNWTAQRDAHVCPPPHSYTPQRLPHPPPPHLPRFPPFEFCVIRVASCKSSKHRSIKCAKLLGSVNDSLGPTE